MIHTNAAFSERIERAVAEVEARTDAEVVVVAAERSGTYLDVSMVSGFAIAVLTLVAAMAVPADIPGPLVVVYVAAAMAFGTWVANGRVFVHSLAPRARQRRQVAAAAAAEFHREAVHATPRRTGLLVYVSALEGRVELIPDVGLQERIPQGAWAQAASDFSHDDLDHFLAGLKRVGDVLAAHVPKLAHDDVDLPNAPRIR